MPREEVSSLAEFKRKRRQGGGGDGGDVADGRPFAEKLTPMDANFILRMKAALPGSMASVAAADDGRSKKKKKKKSSKKKKHGTSIHGRKKEGLAPEKELRGETYTDGDNGANTSRANTGSNESKRTVSDAQADESSDEDIFGGVGEYVPSIPTPTAACKDGSSKATGHKEGEEVGKIRKGSIFSDLTGPDDTKASAAAPAAVAKKKSTSRNKSVSFGASSAVATSAGFKKRNVIDRDVLGARPPDSLGKHKATGGISISDYAGGYGEEMDVDFSGMADAEPADDDDGKKKKSGDLTTTAVMEYGRRSGGGGVKSGDRGGML